MSTPVSTPIGTADGGAAALVQQASPPAGVSVNGSALADFRTKAGLSQRELAAAVGITSGYMSKVENGTANPSDQVLARIADRLNVRVRSLLNRCAICSGDTAATPAQGIPAQVSQDVQDGVA